MLGSGVGSGVVGGRFGIGLGALDVIQDVLACAAESNNKFKH